MIEAASSHAPVRVLIVDDEPDMVSTLAQLVGGEGGEVEPAFSAHEALAACERDEFDVILSDLSMPGMSGVDLLREIKARTPATEVIIITGYGTIDGAVEAMRLGAFNYLIKPVEPDELLDNLSRIRRRLALTGGDPRASGYQGMIGRSAKMRKIFSLIPRVARMRGSVLIQGESGVGKELVARAIHDCGDRRGRPFVPIDCGAMTETLLESELFGHKQGAFTGSITDRAGLIESANGGTLLLDEIGNSSLAMQSRLLRVIEEKKVRRLGANNFLPVDVRFLAAANVDVAEQVNQGRFREDLYYRLCGFVIQVPPLRERRDDIPLLVKHFLDQVGEYLAGAPAFVSPEAMETLMKYAWPGNVRELRIVVERAAALAEGPCIEKRDLVFRPLNGTGSPSPAQPVGEPSSLIDIPFYEAVEEYERKYLSELLERAGGNISHASHLSGASRKTIRDKGRKYGLLD
ncbi:MAG: response regulator [bacterium]|nr:response regulator [bacterium]